MDVLAHTLASPLGVPLGALLAQTDGAGLGSVFDLARKGGVMMIPIGICSLIAVAVFAERSLVLRPSRIAPKGFLKKLRTALASDADDRYQQAERLCAKDQSPAARVVASGLSKLGHAPEVVEKRIAAAGEEEVYAMRHRLRALSVIAAVTPLMGLTGTIFGMIRAFAQVADSSDNLGKAELLAGGIYEAMITTAAGLLVAIPALVAYHWLSGRVERLTRVLDRLAIAFVEEHVLEPSLARDASRVRSADAPRPAPSPAAAPAIDPDPPEAPR